MLVLSCHTNPHFRFFSPLGLFIFSNRFTLRRLVGLICTAHSPSCSRKAASIALWQASLDVIISTIMLLQWQACAKENLTITRPISTHPWQGKIEYGSLASFCKSPKRQGRGTKKSSLFSGRLLLTVNNRRGTKQQFCVASKRWPVTLNLFFLSLPFPLFLFLILFYFFLEKSSQCVWISPRPASK